MLIRGHFGSSDRLTPVGQVFVPPSLTHMKDGSAATSFNAAARDVRLDALAMGTYEDLCRPCVDCGIKFGSYCDGKWGVPCFAAVRVPSEQWCDGQRTPPLCTKCDRMMGMCRFCRGVPSCTPPTRE